MGEGSALLSTHCMNIVHTAIGVEMCVLIARVMNPGNEWWGNTTASNIHSVQKIQCIT